MKKAHFYYRLLNRGSGKLSVTMLGDYYNKNLGAWEPFLEPWRYVPNSEMSWFYCMVTSLAALQTGASYQMDQLSGRL